ncbi:hypothetical protein DH09_17220 [Bacillaceae bacterium JMAK1]|nr:hypothetical protein DH09_17220 [Bacillaceae bacterium JMAK1]
MTITRLARKNLTGHAQRYAAYFLSCVFAVSVFFIYAQFVFHPDVVNGDIRGGDAVRTGMIMAQVIIILFSIFFIAYSNRVFLSTRSKEFGLLSLFGMSKRQLCRLVYFEQTLISVTAILVGLGIGTLFSKLFLMLMSSMLGTESPIEFQFVLSAYLITALGFFVLFQVLTLLSFWRLRKANIQDLLKDARKPKHMPRFSWILTILGLILLIAGYMIAATASIMLAVFLIPPILFLVVTGSYLLFRQGTVALYKKLYDKPSLYSGTNLVTRTNILFRLKDYANMLFLTSTIIAVVLTAGGTVYLLFDSTIRMATNQMATTIAWYNFDEDEPTLEKETADAILAKHDTDILYTIDTEVTPIDFQTGNLETDAVALPESAYNDIAVDMDLPQLNLQSDEVFVAAPFVQNSPEYSLEEGDVINVHSEAYTVYDFTDRPILSTASSGWVQFIVPDETYAQWGSVVDERYQAYGYELDNWKEQGEVSNEIREAADSDHQSYFVQANASDYQMVMQTFSLTLFIGIFVSLLFFIVQGSMLYLKLFTELEDTKKQLLSLKRIGLTKKEAKKILGSKIRFLFFTPYLVGALHASFAFLMLNSMLEGAAGSMLLWNGLLVIGIGALLQLIYFFITRYYFVRAAYKS